MYIELNLVGLSLYNGLLYILHFKVLDCIYTGESMCHVDQQTWVVIGAVHFVPLVVCDVCVCHLCMYVCTWTF